MLKCTNVKWISLLSIVALLAMWIPSTARADVRDNAQIFTQDAVDQANRDMKAMEQKHNKQLVVETFAVVPDDQKDAAKADPKTFFRNWMAARAKELKVNGVYVLICMDPHHVEVGTGKNTVSKGDFTATDVDNLRKQLQADLHDKEYDKALSGSVDTVERAYTENIKTPTGRTAAGRDTEYTHQPAYTPPVYSQPPYNPPFNPSYSSGSNNNSSGLGLTFGALLCMIVGGVIIVSLIRSIFRGGSIGGFGGGFSGGGGGYYPGNQGYGGGYGGGYSGGGGGFGRGILGGLLGGALGSYAENRFEDRDNRNNTGFGGGGGGGQSNDNSSYGNTSSFDPGPSDAGQGFGDTSSGGDFGSSSGGDSGGGGGSSSGGDF